MPRDQSIFWTKFIPRNDGAGDVELAAPRPRMQEGVLVGDEGEVEVTYRVRGSSSERAEYDHRADVSRLFDVVGEIIDAWTGFCRRVTRGAEAIL